jgi:chemotaxis signal transduction protein
MSNPSVRRQRLRFMTNSSNPVFRDDGNSAFVLFPLGNKRFGLPAGMVAELARPDQIQPLPHTTPLLTGVLVRRGKIVPVCDIAQVLIGPGAAARRFYLIASRKVKDASEWTAIPVTGECVLTHGQLSLSSDSLPPYVTGLLIEGQETIEILDLEKLAEVAA